MVFDEEVVRNVWESTRASSNQDPLTWRKDECGAWIKRAQYGNEDSEFGWRIVNVLPGGPDELPNLRAFHFGNYFDAATGWAHCKVVAESEGIANKIADVTHIRK